MACGCGGSSKSKPVGVNEPKTFWNGPQRKASKSAQTASGSKASKPK